MGILHCNQIILYDSGHYEKSLPIISGLSPDSNDFL